MMPSTSRAQRLSEAVERTHDKLEAQRKALAALQSQQRALEKKARDLRRYQVGALADSCGLLDLDDAVLRPLFAVLQGVTHTPNPVAVLEALLKDVCGQPGMSVNGFALPAEGVSATH